MATDTLPAPASAKARLLTLALRSAAAAGVSPTAVAVLAHHLADAWLRDDGWSSETSDQTVASRLGIHVGTVRRSIRELVKAQLIDRRPGDGRCPSRTVVREMRVSASAHPESAPALTLGKRQRPPWVSAGAHPGCAPALAPLIEIQIDQIQQQQQAIAGAAVDRPSLQTTEPAGRPGDDAMGKIETYAVIIRKRPGWIGSKAWLTNQIARELAELPSTTMDVIAWASCLTRERVQQLHNPAGFFIARMRSPDLEDVHRYRSESHRAEMGAAAKLQAALQRDEDRARYNSPEETEARRKLFAEWKAEWEAKQGAPSQ